MEMEKCEKKYFEDRVDDSIPNKERCFNLSQERPRIHQESGSERDDLVILCALPPEWSCVSEGVQLSEGCSYLSRKNWGGWCVSYLWTGVERLSSSWGYIRDLQKLVAQWELMALCLCFPHTFIHCNFLFSCLHPWPVLLGKCWAAEPGQELVQVLQLG